MQGVRLKFLLFPKCLEDMVMLFASVFYLSYDPLVVFAAVFIKFLSTHVCVHLLEAGAHRLIMHNTDAFQRYSLKSTKNTSRLLSADLWKELDSSLKSTGFRRYLLRIAKRWLVW